MVCLALLLTQPVDADTVETAKTNETPESAPEKDKKDSPWPITPLISSDPRISTAGGAMVATIESGQSRKGISSLIPASKYKSTAVHIPATISLC